jgi:endonuclease G, mitochondrial
MKIPVELLQKIEAENPLAIENIQSRLDEIKTNKTIDIDGRDKYIKRRKMISSVAAEDVEDAFERYNGDNDLLPINYLEIGSLKSRSVGRLVYFDLTEMKPSVATGFLISGDLIITNNHVFSDKASFRDGKIEFDYQYDILGNEKEKIIFALDPEKFFHANKDLDVCIIGVKPTDISGKHKLSDRGYLVLNGTTGKAGVGDFAAIIQYPDGHPLQIALRENKVLDISKTDALIYNSDTSRGSSGSPVFNDQWQVIALHSAGVAKKNAAGEYLDANNEIIPVINGKVDGSRVVWLSNRGIRISAIINYLFSDPLVKVNPFIMALMSPTYNDDRQLAFLSLPARDGETESKPQAITAASTQQVTNNLPPVYINISIGDKGQLITTGSAMTGITKPEASLLFEKKIEDKIDFSDCRGFDEFFLEQQTPLPSLAAKLKKKVAFYADNPNTFILKYHHYSSVHHAVRRMPVFSAINIMGKRRYGELTGRTDNWFRDRRIDLDVQLTDDFYYKSKMDKGHMVRREDAEWGYAIESAEIAANMTCSYTNACPQVPALNRDRYGYHGEWGQIEGKILEMGVMKESGEEGKICVYNGPVFDDNDPVFKGIQIPMRYWKIVVWRNKAGEFKTTCFMLSQENLVGDVDFEELHYDDLFKNRQCGISLIEKLTQLKFNLIRDWDTYIPTDGGEEESLIDANGLENLIKKNEGHKKD